VLDAVGEKEEQLGAGLERDVRLEEQAPQLASERRRPGLAGRDDAVAARTEMRRERLDLRALAGAVDALDRDQRARSCR
jgi:hypothetical protein